ncbi:ShlB/FhaC/HecB family hemolysin secretion/activation protein [Rhizobium sp. RU36D]|uniref:ShlB/FhaC/HecB family hemolysin secretion/activation protein n=1 Tax=Rhizobium sp. RU36D TaxID=1907415 RepID=UPI0015C4539F|nr:ShlB/FhaC/HecB family hemolysin secretion/activation protein [Rhizobium sp. RU36D]
MLTGSLSAANAQAQQPPANVDAGALQNRTDRLQRELEDQVTPRRPDGADGVTGPAREQAPEVPPGGPTFELTRVEFTPSYFFSQNELAAIAQPFVGRTLDFSGIQALVNAVNARYSARGIVTASASLPEQDLEGGVLKIELIEGRVGAVSVEGAPRSEEYVRSRVQLQQGTVVDVPKLGSRVSAQNRLGEARIRTILQPGTEFGQTDVTLSVTEPQQNLLDVFTDNFGSKTTGRYQGGFLFQHYGLLGIDDRFKAYGVYSKGNLAGNLSYTFGVSPTGGRLGISYSASRIKIIDGPFADLDVTGSSQGGGLNYAQPIYSDANWLLLANLGATINRSITRQGNLEVTDNITRKPTAGVTINYYGTDIAVSVSPSYAFSTTDLLVTGGSEQAHFFNGSASLTGALPQEFVLQAFGSWQVASTKLVTGDQLFQIGGPTTIRGYDGGAAAGGSGYYANIELHKSFSGDFGSLDLFSFVDHGSVYSTSPAKVSLTGIGVGAGWTINDRVTLEVTGAIPVGQQLPGAPDYTIFGRIIGKVF